jgi:hypothetical protein
MRNRGRVRLLGLALFVYGLIGVGLFVLVAVGLTRPLDRAQRLSTSVEESRAAVVVSLEEAEDTIRQMSAGVERMDASLGEAKAAPDRAAEISRGVASSMYQLRDTVSAEIPFLGQPLIGLAPSFDQSGQNLDLLGEDVAAIGAALDSNRADVVLTAENMVEMADSIEELTRRVDDSPSVEIEPQTINNIRFAIWAVAGWMVLFAAGCALIGAYLMLARRNQPVTVHAPGP